MKYPFCFARDNSPNLNLNETVVMHARVMPKTAIKGSPIEVAEFVGIMSLTPMAETDSL
jgi:hypothetical protein